MDAHARIPSSRTASEDEVLSRSPLALVLAQLRFVGEVTALAQRPATALDDAMRIVGFPIADDRQDFTLQITPSGPAQVAAGIRRVYRDTSGGLRVAVSNSFIAVYVTPLNGSIPYDGHEPFIQKLSEIVSVLGSVVGDVPVARSGYRYVDQFTGKDRDDVESLLKPSCRGVSLTEVPEGALLQSSAFRAQFSWGKSSWLQVQSGLVPAHAIVDAELTAQSESTWVLDIDAFDTEPIPFDPNAVADVASQLQSRAHAFFADIALTDEFVERYR